MLFMAYSPRKRSLLERQRAARSRERPSGTTPPTFVLQLPARGPVPLTFTLH
jgi:hypothetical protein